MLMGGMLTGYRPPTNNNSAKQEEQDKTNEQIDLEDFFGYGSQQRQQEYNSAQAEIAYERQRQLIKDQYGLQVEGMQEAGLNPALMFNSGALSSGLSVAHASQQGNANNQSFTNTLTNGIFNLIGDVIGLFKKGGTSAKTIINNY